MEDVHNHFVLNPSINMNHILGFFLLCKFLSSIYQVKMRLMHIDFHELKRISFLYPSITGQEHKMCDKRIHLCCLKASSEKIIMYGPIPIYHIYLFISITREEESPKRCDESNKWIILKCHNVMIHLLSFG